MTFTFSCSSSGRAPNREVHPRPMPLEFIETLKGLGGLDTYNKDLIKPI